MDWFELTLRLCNSAQFEEESQKVHVRDKKEGRKKQACKVKQTTRQSNTVHVVVITSYNICTITSNNETFSALTCCLLFRTYMYFVRQLFSRMPDVSLECSSNVLHIRTCVDSCVALRDLLVYLATDGDLRPWPSDAAPLESREYSGLAPRDSPRSSLVSGCSERKVAPDRCQPASFFCSFPEFLLHQSRNRHTPHSHCSSPHLLSPLFLPSSLVITGHRRPPK